MFDQEGVCVQKEQIAGSEFPDKDQLLPSDAATIATTHMYILNQLFSIISTDNAHNSGDIECILRASINGADRRKYSLVNRKLKDSTSALCFLQLESIAGQAKKKYGTVTFDHVLSDIGLHSDDQKNNILQVIVLKKVMFIVLKRLGAIQFLNYYKISHNHDRLYYLSLAYQAIAGVQSNVHIELQLEKEDDLSFADLLRRYHKKIDVILLSMLAQSELPRSLQLLIS